MPVIRCVAPAPSCWKHQPTLPGNLKIMLAKLSSELFNWSITVSESLVVLCWSFLYWRQPTGYHNIHSQCQWRHYTGRRAFAKDSVLGGSASGLGILSQRAQIALLLRNMWCIYAKEHQIDSAWRRQKKQIFQKDYFPSSRTVCIDCGTLERFRPVCLKKRRKLSYSRGYVFHPSLRAIFVKHDILITQPLSSASINFKEISSK